MSKVHLRKNIELVENFMKVKIPIFITPISDKDSQYSSVDSYGGKLTEIQNAFPRLSKMALNEFCDYLKVDASIDQLKRIDVDINLSKIILATLSYSLGREAFIFSIYISDLDDYVWDVGFNSDATDVSNWGVDYFEHGGELTYIKGFYSI